MPFLRRFRRRSVAPSSPASVPAAAASARRRLTLHAAPAGCPLVVRELRADPAACLRLRELGFCEAARVAKVSHGGNLICQVCGVRVALARRLAELVVVEPAAPLPAS